MTDERAVRLAAELGAAKVRIAELEAEVKRLEAQIRHGHPSRAVRDIWNALDGGAA